MDSLLGHKPNFSCSHAINVLTTQEYNIASPTSHTSTEAETEDDTNGIREYSEVVNTEITQTPSTSRSCTLTETAQPVGIQTLKRKLLEQKIIDNEKRQVKMRLLERKLALDERKCDLLERYLKLKETELEK
ncbi:hypothetical protein RI129_002726 [Pyrocoelia pectoralis]|uniref:Uncharacterized protein n=1 Tax=Pyrocoelia pectoralis TaxID=417401 RepID=A0AAN7VPF9_9COLE